MTQLILEKATLSHMVAVKRSEGMLEENVMGGDVCGGSGVSAQRTEAATGGREKRRGSEIHFSRFPVGH